ncbi:MAG: hypothetical protein K0Q43_5659 [Ramlibacter sp.]|jgi:Flp pilus assembly protein TadG|nr:hypothetical protein [Ramlibacter sp.]
MYRATRHHQRGAVIVTVCMLLLFLLGFIGMGLDFGKLFVVKSELQTAMDSCALAAAQELDLTPSAIDRATSAGRTAGNLNRVNFQSATWSGQGQLVNADITFKAPDYSVTTDPAVAQYVECRHVQPGVRLWLLQALGAFSGDTTMYPPTQNVMAAAVATRAHGQSTCPLPVAMKPRECSPGVACTAPDYGFSVGEWVTMITDQSEFSGGQIGWMSLVEGEVGTNEIRNQLKGYCGTKVTDQLVPSDSGSKVALAPIWNYRFGLYASQPDFTLEPEKRPDLTGFSYASGPNVYSDFANRRSTNDACGATVAECEAGGWSFTGNIRYIVPGGDGPGTHGTEGTNRRLVLVPVVDATNHVDGFACMLLVQPLSIPLAPVSLEYRGNASLPTSPCSFSGMPGGVAGPLVPALVR